MALDETPQDTRAWMRMIQADVTQLKRHTHPALDQTSVPALDQRVTVLEGQVAGIETDIAGLQASVGALQSDVADLGLAVADLGLVIDHLSRDTGFAAFTNPPAGWTYGSQAGVRTVGLFTTVTILITRNVGAGTSTTSFTLSDVLPAEAIPDDTVYFMLNNTTAGTNGLDRRGTISGGSNDISIGGSSEQGVTEGNLLAGSVTYPTP